MVSVSLLVYILSDKKRILHECLCFIEFIKPDGEKEIKWEACNKFNNFNNTGAQMLDSIHHYIIT